ncbi:hypothetical protein HDU96_008831 [Phlyctochytrium bullatum]|nr:hypothetical protein HDU96_008831 [Phlyctochytrium bullatum]
MADQIALVKLQDYLPTHYLSVLLSHVDGWPDDPIEYPYNFDSSLDFWQLYREGLERDGADLSHWHVQNKKRIENLDEDTMKRIEELEKKRAEAEAKLQKKRLMKEKEMERLKQQILYTVQNPGDEYHGGPVDMKRRRSEKTPDGAHADEEEEDDFSSSAGDSLQDAKHKDDGMANASNNAGTSVFDEIEDEEISRMKAAAPRERRKSVALGLKKIPDSKKLREIYGLDAKGRGGNGLKSIDSSNGQGQGHTGAKDDDDDAGGDGSTSTGGNHLRLRFTLPTVTGNEGSSRQTGPLKTLQELNAERMGHTGHPIKLERQPMYAEQSASTAPKSQAEIRADQIQASRQAAMAEVANPFARLIPASNNRGDANKDGSKDQAKNWIRDQMARAGMLPNSVITAQIQEEKRRKLREIQEERERREKEKQQTAVVNVNPFQRPKHLQSRRPKKTVDPVFEQGVKEEEKIDLQDDAEEDKEKEKEAERAAKEAQRQKEMMEKLKKIEEEERAAAAERAMEKERAEIARRKERERMEREEAEEQERLRREEEERLREEEEGARAAAEAARLARQQYMEQLAAQERAEEEARKATPPEPPPKKEKQLPTLKDLRDRASLVPVRPLKKKPPSPPPVKEPPPVKPKVEFKRPLIERPRPPIAVMKEPLPVRLDSDDTVATEGGSSAGSQSPEPKEQSYEPLFMPEDMIEKKMEAKHAWGLLEKASKNNNEDTTHSSIPIIQIQQSYEDISPEFSNVINNFWFPGLGGREVNLTNIIEVLFKLMKNGLWSEKCEASKAVLYLYHTFERDFLDPMSTLIYPQLEFTNDQAWQFRAQMCLNLVGYKIYHPDIIQSIICRLNDKHEIVRYISTSELQLRFEGK